jgi:hypothetical protein
MARSQTVESASAVIASEGEAVELWRFECLIDAGYTEAQAETLALLKHVDLHQAVDMVAAGCDPDLAFDILS